MGQEKGGMKYKDGVNTNIAMGLKGFKIITTGTETADFVCIVPDLGAAATFAATCVSGDALTSGSRTSPVLGDFTSVTVTAGQVLAYYG